MRGNFGTDGGLFSDHDKKAAIGEIDRPRSLHPGENDIDHPVELRGVPQDQRRPDEAVSSAALCTASQSPASRPK